MADPQVMSGQQTYPPTRCRCSHQEALHEIGKRGGKSVRTYCSARCGCKAFHPVEEPLPTECPHCGAPWAPDEARRKRERDG